MDDNKKYRILYNDNKVVDVLEDSGTTYIGAETEYMVMVDTKENAKIMLEAVNIDTFRLFNERADIIETPELTGFNDLNLQDITRNSYLSGFNDLNLQDMIGIHYLNNINNSFDPRNITGGII